MPIYSYRETATAKFNFVSDGSEAPAPVGFHEGRSFIYLDGAILDQPTELDLRPHDPLDPTLEALRDRAAPAGSVLDREVALAGMGLSTVERVQDRAFEEVSAYVRTARARIAGADDPVKLAEYADKAALADRVLDGQASPDDLTMIEDEAADFGLDTAEAMASVWRVKALGLRQARLTVNRMERDTMAALRQATTPQAVVDALADAQAQDEAAFADLAVEQAQGWPPTGETPP